MYSGYSAEICGLAGRSQLRRQLQGTDFFAYPQYRTRGSGPHSKFWYSLVGVLAPAVMLLTPNSTLLPDDLSIVVLLGCLWLGGVYAGVALVRESPDFSGSEKRSTSQSSLSNYRLRKVNYPLEKSCDTDEYQ